MSEPKTANKNDSDLDFKGLEFEEFLEDLLQIKPVENADLKKANPKRKRANQKLKNRIALRG